jgi:hypothetical protein
MTNAELNIFCLNFSPLLDGPVGQIWLKLTTEDSNIIDSSLFIGFHGMFGFAFPTILD